jgi:hypothetical protein
MGVGVQFSAPFAHHMLNKAECHWCILRETHPRCFTVCPPQIPCGRALFALLCTFATVHIAALLVSPVAFHSPCSRRIARRLQIPRLRVHGLRQRARQVTSETRRNGVSWRHGWLPA